MAHVKSRMKEVDFVSASSNLGGAVIVTMVQDAWKALCWLLSEVIHYTTLTLEEIDLWLNRHLA